MKDVIKGYIDFISENKTERECVQAIIRAAREHGYTDLAEAKQLKPGDRVWYNKMGKSIALFQIGTEDIAKGMNILGAHLDSPRLDAKQRPVWEKDGLVYLNTHYYGGIKKYQWLALPLAIHGVVFLTDGSRVDIVIGEKADDPVFCISDILPHIAQDQMKKTAAEFIEGEKLDLVIGSFGEADKGKDVILGLLKDKYGIAEDDFMSAELEIVPAGAARESGLDRSCVLGYGQDDRVCSYTSFQALLDTPVSKRTSCCLLVDKEEIGSCGATGMRSRFLDNAVAAVVEKLGAPSEFVVRRALENSMMLSSDVNSAYDPLNWELYDKTNSSFLGRGLVFNKYTGSRGKSNASDANPEFIALVRAQMEKHNVTYQSAEMAKVDVGGGGTIALYAAYYGMQVIDAGVPVLSMHAPWELTNRFDIQQAYEGYCTFLLID
ncbi:MAG: aminopeptidase [Spirochaetales bacterium]|nr:aminopeptidase [Spirochaetales bacterium]